MLIADGSPAAQEFRSAVQSGDVTRLRVLLRGDAALATARFGTSSVSRAALHVVTDHPGHFPNCVETIEALVAGGADVNARFVGSHRETPLHWAASSNDVQAIGALIDAGADLEADGAVLTGGSALDDAVIFGQWEAARLLVERGARTVLFHAAALNMTDRLLELLGRRPDVGETSDLQEITQALWHACRAGHAEAAGLLVQAGGDPRWVGWDDTSALDLAVESGDATLIGAVAAQPG